MDACGSDAYLAKPIAGFSFNLILLDDILPQQEVNQYALIVNNWELVDVEFIHHLQRLRRRCRAFDEDRLGTGDGAACILKRVPSKQCPAKISIGQHCNQLSLLIAKGQRAGTGCIERLHRVANRPGGREDHGLKIRHVGDVFHVGSLIGLSCTTQIEFNDSPELLQQPLPEGSSAWLCSRARRDRFGQLSLFRMRYSQQHQLH